MFYWPCPWKSSVVSKNKPKCFWDTDWVTVLLLKLSVGWVDFWSLREKITSWPCLLGSRLKLIFHWKAQLFMFKSWYNLFDDKCLSFITEKSYLSLGNSLGFKIKLSDKSYVCIKKVVDLELNLEGHLLQHFECSIYKLDLHVKLYQKPWICREKLLWRQKIDIFHE